jgi:uncharacterized protein (DUF2384 family)
MAAIAPFIEHDELVDLEPMLVSPPMLVPPPADLAGSEPFSRLPDSHSIEAEIAHRNLLLAQQDEIPDELRFFVDWLADQLVSLPDDAALRVDPYFLVSAQRAILGALRALDSDDPLLARRQLRVRLEQLRQVYRDIAEGEMVYEDRPPKQLAAWLAETLDVSQARLAELAGVSARTFQRWASASDSTAPDGEEARRLRVIAQAANHLRHVLTGSGVVRWFEQPNPQLEGRRPLDLLPDADAAAKLSTLAASVRSHSAA